MSNADIETGWSNEKDEAKSIMFDATRDNAVISMSTEEITLEEVRKELEILPYGIRNNVKNAIFYPSMWLYGY